MAAGMKKIKPVEPVISETQNNPYMDAITQAEASRGSDKPVTAAVPVSEGPDPWGYKPTENYTTGLSDMVWNPDVRGMDFQEDSLPTGTRSYERSSYSASSGGNRSPYAAAIDAFDYGPAPQWGGTEYERRRDEALRRAEDMKFEFDPDTDPSWQAYQKQYRREGQRATADALGQAAAMTGGVPSSYAVTAASQAGDYYAAQLSDRLPQLYQDAYNRYLQEYQRQLGIADAYAGYGQTEYNRYLDQLGQYNTDRNFAYGAYRDQIGDQRYETQWAQEMREYEDKLAQQARENGWTEQEYQDKLKQQRYDNALKFYSQFGYIPEEYADLFSSWAGMGQQAQTPQYIYLGDPNTDPETPPEGNGSPFTLANAYQNAIDNLVKQGLTTEKAEAWAASRNFDEKKISTVAQKMMEAYGANLPADQRIAGMNKIMSSYNLTKQEKDYLMKMFGLSGETETIGNRHSTDWVALGDNQRVSLQELDTLVENGDVIETIKNGVHWYEWANGANGGK